MGKSCFKKIGKSGMLDFIAMVDSNMTMERYNTISLKDKDDGYLISLLGDNVISRYCFTDDNCYCMIDDCKLGKSINKDYSAIWKSYLTTKLGVDKEYIQNQISHKQNEIIQTYGYYLGTVKSCRDSSNNDFLNAYCRYLDKISELKNELKTLEQIPTIDYGEAPKILGSENITFEQYKAFYGSDPVEDGMEEN